jgi:hypothetical protein
MQCYNYLKDKKYRRINSLKTFDNFKYIVFKITVSIILFSKHQMPRHTMPYRRITDIAAKPLRKTKNSQLMCVQNDSVFNP